MAKSALNLNLDGQVSFAVLFEESKKLGWSDVERALRACSDARTKKRTDWLELTPTDGGVGTVTVILQRGDAVIDEAKEMAEEEADSAFAPRIARANARFEVYWDPDDVGDLVNLLGEVQEELERLTGGVSYDDDGIRPPLAAPPKPAPAKTKAKARAAPVAKKKKRSRTR